MAVQRSYTLAACHARRKRRNEAGPVLLLQLRQNFLYCRSLRFQVLVDVFLRLDTTSAGFDLPRLPNGPRLQRHGAMRMLPRRGSSGGRTMNTAFIKLLATSSTSASTADIFVVRSHGVKRAEYLE
jgi:hypothetical protein